MSAIKHVHIYVYYRKTLQGVDLFKCDDPHCTHTADRKLIMNKASRCSKCRTKELILDWRNLRRRRPVCLGCSNTIEGKEFRHTQEVMANLLGEIKK